MWVRIPSIILVPGFGRPIRGGGTYVQRAPKNRAGSLPGWPTIQPPSSIRVGSVVGVGVGVSKLLHRHSPKRVSGQMTDRISGD
jgi:hypothetical protein